MNGMEPDVDGCSLIEFMSAQGMIVQYFEPLVRSAASGPKLIYFGLGGRAEAIRALCAHANFKYTDERI